MNRTATKLLTLFAVFGSLFLSIQATAQGTNSGTARDNNRLVSATATVDYASKYVWRGILLTDGAVLQPSAEVAFDLGAGEIAAGWWGSMDVDDVYGRENEFTEYDWTLSFRSDKLLAIGRSPIYIEFGTIHYYYPNDGLDDSDYWDLFTEVRVPLMATDDFAMKAFTKAYYEADDVHGWYVTTGLTTGIPIRDKWSLIGQASLGWASANYNYYYFGRRNPVFKQAPWDQQVSVWSVSKNNASGFNDATVSLALRGEIDQNVYMQFSANFSELIDDDVEDNADILYRDSDNFWFSWKISATF